MTMKFSTHILLFSMFGFSPLSYSQERQSFEASDLPRLVAIVERDQAAYEEQLLRYRRSLAVSEEALRDAVSSLSEKKTSLAIAEKQALREGTAGENERFTKRLELAVKFAEGEVNLQQRRVLRITRKRDEAAEGIRLNQEAKAALQVLDQDELVP